jgi:hypothetical protein
MHAGANLTPCVGTSSARPDLGIDKDRPDYTVYCDAAASMKLAEALRWFWWMTVIGPMTLGPLGRPWKRRRRSFRRVGTPGKRAQNRRRRQSNRDKFLG